MCKGWSVFSHHRENDKMGQSVQCKLSGHTHTHTHVSIGTLKFLDSIVFTFFRYAGKLAYVYDKVRENSKCESSVRNIPISVKFLISLSCDATAEACGGSGGRR